MHCCDSWNVVVFCCIQYKCSCHAPTYIILLVCAAGLEVCGVSNDLLCFYNGTCVDDVCVCPMPFTGANCTEEICELRMCLCVCMRMCGMVRMYVTIQR